MSPGRENNLTLQRSPHKHNVKVSNMEPLIGKHITHYITSYASAVCVGVRVWLNRITISMSVSLPPHIY